MGMLTIQILVPEKDETIGIFICLDVLIAQSLVQLCRLVYRQCHVTVLTTANEKIVGIVIWNAHITLYQTLEG